MITIRISSAEREWNDLDEIEESWIDQQINRRLADGLPVSVTVAIDTIAVRVRLSTPACSPSRRGSRLPTPEEQRVFDLWSERGLTANAFHGEELIAFFRQVGRLL